jgi:hypothetical protein
MRQTFSMAVLIVAFVLSAWGNVIAASFCPRYALNRECCVKHIVSQPKEVESSSCHHEMAGMEMDDMQMETEAAQDPSTDSNAQSSKAEEALESSNDQVAFDLPIEQCAHCWSHSQPTLGTVSVVAADPSKQLVETSSPRADSQFGLPSVSPVSISPTEHSPPGFTLPRHVLINVFRI